MEAKLGQPRCVSGGELKDIFPFPEQKQLRANLGRLTYNCVEISRGFRPPAHNSVIGGDSTSRHMGCLAADVSIFDDEGRGISRQQVAHEAQSLDVGFEKAAN